MSEPEGNSRVPPILRRLARTLLPAGTRHMLGTWVGERGIPRLPDRLYLTGTILPALAAKAGTILFVGCRPYTKDYPNMLGAQGGECWTLDIDPGVMRWGAAGHHVVAALQDAGAHWPPASFDTVVVNGVFGYGLDNQADQTAALNTVRLLLKPQGWFVLGWNTDRSADPQTLPILPRLFEPARLTSLPTRQRFAHSTHVYDCYLPATAGWGDTQS